MATRFVYDKIPYDFRVKGVATMDANVRRPQRGQAVSQRKSTDAVKPSVKGLAAAIKRTVVAADALLSLVSARDGNSPEAAAIASKLLANKEFMAQLKTALSDIERDIPVAPQKASNGLSAARNEVAGTQEERDEINARICAEEGLTGAGYPTKDAAGTNAYLAGAKEMIERMKEESVETRKRIAKTESAVETAATVLQRELAKGKSIEEARAAARKAVLNQHAEAASAGGLIGDSSWADPYAAVETARQAPNGSAWTPQAIAKREAAQQRVSKLGAAIEGDTLQNALRVRFGQAPVSVDGDALYELLEGKK